MFDLIYNVIKDIVLFAFIKLSQNHVLIFYILALTSIGFVVFYKYLKKPQNKILTKITSFLNGLKDGAFSIMKMRHRNAFIGHTLFIWTMYILMFYVIFFALDETKVISLGAVLTSFVTGSFTIATTNGGLGSYPYVIYETLAVFNVSKPTGLAIGWIMWSAQTILTIILGAFSFFYIPIFNRKK